MSVTETTPGFRIKGWHVLTGMISFNDKGDRVGEVYRVYRVDNQGAFVLQP